MLLEYSAGSFVEIFRWSWWYFLHDHT